MKKYISNFSLQFLTNFTLRLLSNILPRFLGIITLPIIARALNSDGFGKFNLIIAILSYFSLLPNLGFLNFGIKEVVIADSKEKIVNNILSVRIILFLISSLIGLVIIFILNRNIFFYVLIGQLIILGQALSLEFYYVAIGNIKILTISQILSQIIFLFLIFFYHNNPIFFLLLIFFNGLLFLLPSLIQIFFYTREKSIKIKFDIIDTIKTIKRVFNFGIAQVLDSLMGSLPILLLSLYLQSFQIGIFAGTQKIFSIVLLFFLSFNITITPYIIEKMKNPTTKNIKRIRHIMISTTLLGFSFGSIIFFNANMIVYIILGNNFYDSIKYLKLISFLIIAFYPINMILGTVLLFSGNEKYYIFSMICNLLTFSLSAIKLIPLFEIYGIFIALFIGLFSSLIINFYRVTNLFRIIG